MTQILADIHYRHDTVIPSPANPQGVNMTDRGIYLKQKPSNNFTRHGLTRDLHGLFPLYLTLKLLLLFILRDILALLRK